jgi:hypothetical protein
MSRRFGKSGTIAQRQRFARELRGGGAVNLLLAAGLFRGKDAQRLRDAVLGERRVEARDLEWRELDAAGDQREAVLAVLRTRGGDAGALQLGDERLDTELLEQLDERDVERTPSDSFSVTSPAKSPSKL